MQIQLQQSNHQTGVRQRTKSQTTKKSKSRISEVQQAIEVLSDDEEQQIIQNKYQQELMRNKIEEAKITKSKIIILKTLYTELHYPGKSTDEKNRKFNEVVKNFVSKSLTNSKGIPFDLKNSHFNQKMIAKQGEQFIQNEYILYGVDLVSQRQIQRIFQRHTPSIKWIDSSHCKLTFMQKQKGWQAIIDTCHSVDSLEVTLSATTKVQDLLSNLLLQEEEKKESKLNAEYKRLEKFKKTYHLIKNYIDLMPYYQMDFKRRLMIRNATHSEQLIGHNIQGKDQAQKSQSFSTSDYKKYIAVKNQLFQTLQNQSLVKNQYQKIKQQMASEYQGVRLRGNYGKHKQHSNNNYKSSYKDRQYQKQSDFYNNSQNYPQHQQPQHYQGNLNFKSQRNRSRQYQYRGNFRKNNNRNKFDQVQQTFDRYIQRRDGIAQLGEEQYNIQLQNAYIYQQQQALLQQQNYQMTANYGQTDYDWGQTHNQGNFNQQRSPQTIYNNQYTHPQQYNQHQNAQGYTKNKQNFTKNKRSNQSHYTDRSSDFGPNFQQKYPQKTGNKNKNKSNQILSEIQGDALKKSTVSKGSNRGSNIGSNLGSNLGLQQILQQCLQDNSVIQEKMEYQQFGNNLPQGAYKYNALDSDDQDLEFILNQDMSRKSTK